MKHLRGEKQKIKARELRHLYEQYRTLNRQIWNQPLVPLAKPIQKGYKRSLTLRDDIARRDDAHIFWAILNKVNNTIYSKDQEFKIYTKKHNKVFATDKVHIPRTITRADFEKWNPPPNITKHFVYVKTVHTKKFGSYTTEHYEVAKPWIFKQGEIEPNFLTHARTFNPEAEKQLGEIKRKLESINFWNSAKKLLNWSNNHKEDRGTQEDKLFKLHFQEQLNEFINEHAEQLV